MNERIGRIKQKTKSNIGRWLKYVRWKNKKAECKIIKQYEELSNDEVLTLAYTSGTFDFLDDAGEDIYTRSDGVPITFK